MADPATQSARRSTSPNRGFVAALLTPLLMGMTPIFGKAATLAGADPFAVAGWRTLLAALLLWVVFGVALRRYLYIFPAGLLGTVAVGTVNGLGSLLFYNGLVRLDASLAQLLYLLYVVFAMLLTRAFGHAISRLTLVRATVALGAVVLLTGGTAASPDWRGVTMMVGAALMYALHVVLSQRVMYEMPAPTMSIYALTAMAVTVTVAWWIHGRGPAVVTEPVSRQAWTMLVALALVTAASRLTLFVGVKHLGGLRAILLNVAELVVALVAAYLVFGDRLSVVQWLGAGLMVLSMLLAHWDRGQPSVSYRPLVVSRAPDQTPTTP